MIPEVLGGIVIGYLLRKGVSVLLKILGLVLVLIVLLLSWLESAGIVTVNWSMLWSTLEAWLEGLTSVIQGLLAGRAVPGLQDYLVPGALGLGGLLVGWWIGGKL